MSGEIRCVAPSRVTAESAPVIERVARAIESAELRWQMRLTRLVDDESTYTLWIEDEAPREFPGTDELYAYVNDRKRQSMARAAIEAGRVPELWEALGNLVDIIDAAGLQNLSNGVQLGQTSWYVKASDRLEAARTVLVKAGAESGQ